jgi:hypothetical protein
MNKRNTGAPERRYIKTTLRIDLNTRDAGAEGAQSLVGHAAVFNQLSQDLGGFVEQIAPGAFTRAIAEDDPVALFQHDARYVLGRVSSGTLTLAQDSTGLAVEIMPPNTRLIHDLVMVPVARGDIKQMSFGFEVMPNGDTWEKDAQGRYVRTLHEVRLYDVSPVTYPAYTQTDVAVRSFEKYLDAEVKAAANQEQQRCGAYLEMARRRLRIHGAD